MEKKLYREMYNLEKKHWWFVGRRKILFDVIRRTVGDGVGSVLDIGCGTGLNALLLEHIGKEVWGLEASDEAIALARTRAPALKIIKGEFPHAAVSRRFDLITLFDVLEHCEGDRAALRAAHALLNSNGYVVLTVPAFSFLWSEHDALAHHKRRYTARELKKKLGLAGFSHVRVTYFNTFLFLPILFFRLLMKLFRLRGGKTDFFDAPGPMNEFLSSLFGSERFFLRFINFPLGVSLLAIARKL